MDCYWEETDLFHLYANPPGAHGRLMATIESEDVAKRYLFELAGVPIESWKPSQFSENGNCVDIWISRYTSEALMEYEAAGTYFTAERVRVVRINSDKQTA